MCLIGGTASAIIASRGMVSLRLPGNVSNVILMDVEFSTGAIRKKKFLTDRLRSGRLVSVQESDMTKITYYKVLAADGCSPAHGGTGKWFLPKGKRVGKWMPAIKPVLCQQGYHFVTLDQLPRWIGPTLYEIEVRGEVLTAEDKSVAEQARLIKRVDTWNEKNLRLFAADCAEHVLGIYEKQYPKDERPRKAIQAARDFANGLIDAAYAANAANVAVVYAAANAANAAYADEKTWQIEQLKYYLW